MHLDRGKNRLTIYLDSRNRERYEDRITIHTMAANDHAVSVGSKDDEITFNLMNHMIVLNDLKEHFNVNLAIFNYVHIFLVKLLGERDHMIQLNLKEFSSNTSSTTS